MIMKTLNPEILNPERFEAWLFAQPPERVFDYGDVKGCALCAFVAETSGARIYAGGDQFCWVDENGFLTTNFPFHPDIVEAMKGRRTFGGAMFTIGNVQKHWRKLHPEMIEHEIAVSGPVEVKREVV